MTVHASDIVSPPQVLAEERPRVVRSRTGPYRRFFKRTIDILLVMAALPFVVPFIATIALAIMIDGSSPFFRQERVGKDGRRFFMWKLRTMVPNAEELLEQHLQDCAHARLEWNTKQKLSYDPRCTAIGRVLRRTSMDELPQLWNVLIGEMSLVGPRPMLPSQQALYPGGSYYRLRPGMTGSWQVSARNESEFSERARYDDVYDRTLSFGLDCAILARTLRVVIRGTGV